MTSSQAFELPKVKLEEVELGVQVQDFQTTHWRNASLRILRPFSWDAKHRAFELVDIEILEDKPRILVSGPYATADAAAWNVDPQCDVGFPENEEHDGVLYVTQGKPAEPEDRYQDAAGWFTISGSLADGTQAYVAIALERSNTQLVLVEINCGRLSVKLILPQQVYPIASCNELIDLPQMKVKTGLGSHLDGQEQLRDLIRLSMPERARNYLAPLIVDTWGFGTNVNQDLVTSVAKTAKLLDLEVLTIDKGWESCVGDWIPGENFPDGLAGLRRITSENNTRLGLWASLGNADPLSRVAKMHPDWIATWRGKAQVVSHRSNSLCLGHGPVIDYLAEAISNLATNGLTWLLHDFETISRCDSSNHDHPAGLGEDWAVRGWYRLLSEFRARHPEVWIENCWNGGRPLDLQMVAHHDTTIGDDWCDVRHNAVAKVGLGQFLPAHWCSSYMSDQNQLPLRAQLAPYAVGGPWILMGDIPSWTTEKLKLAEKVMKVYRSWRPMFPEGSVTWSEVSGWQPNSGWRADQDVLAISFVHPSGKELVAVVVSEEVPDRQLWIRPKHPGAFELTDEFSGEKSFFSAEEASRGIAISGSNPEGYLFSINPL